MTKVIRFVTRYSGVHQHFYPDDVAQEVYDKMTEEFKNWKQFKNDRSETFSFDHPNSSFTVRLSELDVVVISKIEDVELEKEMAAIKKRREGLEINE